MNDHIYLLVLRLLHVGCGILWAGSVIFLTFFVDPAIKASGPEGMKVMQQLVKTNRFPVVIMLLAITTVVAGLLLIWKISAGLQTVWLSSKNGMVLTSGAILAIIAFIIGFTISRPTSMKMAKIAKQVAMAGAPPTSAQVQELKRLGNRISSAGKFIAVLLLFAIIGMSIFRYL